MLSRKRSLALQALLVIFAVVLANQGWFSGWVNNTEISLTGAQIHPGFSAGLIVLGLSIAIATYLPGKAVSALSVLQAIISAWLVRLTLDASSVNQVLIDSGQVSKLSGQAGPLAELSALITEQSTSPAIFVFLANCLLLALLELATAISATKWPLTKRAKATEVSAKTSFDLWDSQR